MLTGKTIRGFAAVIVVTGLLQAVPSYSQVSGNGPLADTGSSEIAATDPYLENCQDHEDPEDYIWNSSDVIHIVLALTPMVPLP
jgi:hypothetical protein